VSCWGCNFAFLLEVTESGTHIVSGMVLGEIERQDEVFSGTTASEFADKGMDSLFHYAGPGMESERVRLFGTAPMPEPYTPREIALAMARAERREDYETCAVLRDRLKALQNPII
jgi:hypothetical protein